MIAGIAIKKHCYVEEMKGDRIRGVPLDMRRIHPECGNSSEHSVIAELVLRQEPDEEEDEEEDEDDGTKDDDGDDSGYSE